LTVKKKRTTITSKLKVPKSKEKIHSSSGLKKKEDQRAVALMGRRKERPKRPRKKGSKEVKDYINFGSYKKSPEAIPQKSSRTKRS